MNEQERTELEEAVWKNIRRVIDPDFQISLVDLGLIYEVVVKDDTTVDIKMTLTSMGCPAAPYLQAGVHEAASDVEGIADAFVEIIWSPPWDPGTMASDDAKMLLNIY